MLRVSNWHAMNSTNCNRINERNAQSDNINISANPQLNIIIGQINISGRINFFYILYEIYYTTPCEYP